MAQVAISGNVAGGAVTSSNQSFVTVGGVRVLVHGDPVASHGTGLHSAASMDKGPEDEFFFTIGGRAVIVSGDAATCGHTITGTGFVDVG